jgi:two-component system chemotaxis response regulator CheY
MSKTVMIVDDSMIMTQKLSVILRDLGHQVVRVCKNGAEALRDYPLLKPDFVTMDITMPGMDGIDTMIGIMASNPEARVIMVTSHGQEAMVVRALEAGALGYVLKPVTKQGLAVMIERAMAHIRADDLSSPKTGRAMNRNKLNDPDVVIAAAR